MIFKYPPHAYKEVNVSLRIKDVEWYEIMMDVNGFLEGKTAIEMPFQTSPTIL